MGTSQKKVPSQQSLVPSMSSASQSSPFSNTNSVGRLTRTYLAVARKLKMERHGKLAEEIGNFDAEAARLDSQVHHVQPVPVLSARGGFCVCLVQLACACRCPPVARRLFARVPPV
jgi:hypothetical protein